MAIQLGALGNQSSMMQSGINSNVSMRSNTVSTMNNAQTTDSFQMVEDLLGLLAMGLGQAQSNQEARNQQLSKLDEQANQVANTPVGPRGLAKKGGKGGFIPPGLAKKSAADLPEGNPWRSALQQREDSQALEQERAKVIEEGSTAQAEEEATLMGLTLLSMLSLFQAASQPSQAPVNEASEAKVDEGQVASQPAETPAKESAVVGVVSSQAAA